MPIILMLVTALAGGGAPIPPDELRHIADVSPPSQRNAKVEPAEPAPPPEPAPAPVPEADTSAAPEPAERAAPTALDEGWAVQVGAYADRASAQRAADQIGWQGIVIVPTRRDGRDIYVVLLGTWPSRDEADSRGRGYTSETGGDYWVRSASGLQMIKRP